jgi:hypothetical protein
MDTPTPVLTPAKIPAKIKNIANKISTASVEDKVKMGVYIVGGVIVIAAIWKLYKHFFPSNPQTATSNEAGSEVNKNNLSYPLAQYSANADSISTDIQNWAAALFGGSSYIDDVKSIFQSMKNKDDILQLISAFGTRTFYHTSMFDWSSETDSLAGWIALLKDDDRNAINQSIVSTGFTF